MTDAEEVAALRETVLAYNGALRSAHAIAKREGNETNWPAFLANITKVIDDNHGTFVKALLIARAGRGAEEAGVVGGATSP